jgi:hypothetical protein
MEQYKIMSNTDSMLVIDRNITSEILNAYESPVTSNMGNENEIHSLNEYFVISFWRTTPNSKVAYSSNFIAPIVIYAEDSKTLQGLYIIPYHDIRWMLPIKIQNVEINNTFKARSVLELAQEYFDNNNKHGIKTGCIATCKSFDLYYNELIADMVLNQPETALDNFMKRYMRMLNMKQWQGKTFKDSEIN